MVSRRTSSGLMLGPLAGTPPAYAHTPEMHGSQSASRPFPANSGLPISDKRIADRGHDAVG